ncbi:fumarylacetoacetate hydrolase family protein [Sphingosinicella sp.]|jgi:fumarylpyruvate hydrolase|uniref:fumarylacetoacetate hydrolase family protein n=1 Tax=Sphingosinicella sp. TaxID=1917971 RepID=UPI0017D038E9|nr:fumarylacetoacetate hydrolase family protein [Sphingosinicella sp.]MBA4757500.1 fumarylacetoacetate hydrolase family protein [Sphingosinicella sp.]MEA3540470.1 fumarylacetoacetate hydrolase family protein [Pseudomonadota bacterium]
MMDLPKVEVPTIAIAGSTQRFPVRRIFCVGQNYADHAREMGSNPDREQPFFFSKPADAVVESGAVLPFPRQTNNLHHEVELVVALGAGGSDVSAQDAAAMVFGHAVGIDLTRRDLQADAKAKGRPWDMAKGFDASAPVGALTPGAPPAAGAITLRVNGDLRQNGDLSQMIWNVAEVISTLSTYVALAPGDLIFTGTPAGVGPIQPGETVVAEISGTAPVEIRFTA